MILLTSYISFNESHSVLQPALQLSSRRGFARLPTGSNTRDDVHLQPPPTSPIPASSSTPPTLASLVSTTNCSTRANFYWPLLASWSLIGPVRPNRSLMEDTFCRKWPNERGERIDASRCSHDGPQNGNKKRLRRPERWIL